MTLPESNDIIDVFLRASEFRDRGSKIEGSNQRKKS